MRIKIKEKNRFKEIKTKKNISVKELAKGLGILIQNYIARVNDRIVPDNERLKEGDRIEFMKVISGG